MKGQVLVFKIYIPESYQAKHIQRKQLLNDDVVQITKMLREIGFEEAIKAMIISLVAISQLFGRRMDLN